MPMASEPAAEGGVMRGFPPSPDRRVTLDNWDRPPFNRWSFLNVRQVIPTAEVGRGDGPATLFEQAGRDLGEVAFEELSGRPTTVARLLAETYTDGFLVLHRGAIVTELYFNGMTPGTLHLSQSVAKSIVGTVAGMLIDEGLLDPAAPLTDQVPELAGCGYKDATLDQVLDMRSGVRFTEDYGQPGADISRLEAASGWRDNPDPDLPDSIYDLILTLPQERPHGGAFQYRSVEADVLGWVLERASGTALPELVRAKLWSCLGVEQAASFTVDRAGTALADGGFNATLRDYARFGQAYLQNGFFNGRQIVPEAWVRSTRRGDQSAFGEPYRAQTPDGAYRRQWWVKDVDAGVTMALGVFGQMIYVDPTADLDAVKLSTWPDYLNLEFKLNTLRALEAIAAELAEG
jgi:CubicO group peptidase (beta-lactamase class C family)